MTFANELGIVGDVILSFATESGSFIKPITQRYRTKIYYAHPYNAWERGSNENANKLIRRFIPKGANIGEFSHERIQMIEHWINNYPRRIFGGLSSNMIKIHLNVT